jgi:hypothetical protein
MMKIEARMVDYTPALAAGRVARHPRATDTSGELPFDSPASALAQGKPVAPALSVS